MPNLGTAEGLQALGTALGSVQAGYSGQLPTYLNQLDAMKKQKAQSAALQKLIMPSADLKDQIFGNRQQVQSLLDAGLTESALKVGNPALSKMLQAPIISKPGDIARDAQGNKLWENPVAPEFATGDYGEYQRLVAAKQFDGSFLDFKRAVAEATRAPNSEANKPDYKNIYNKATGDLIGSFNINDPTVRTKLDGGVWTFAEKRQDQPTQDQNMAAFLAGNIADSLSVIKPVVEKDPSAISSWALDATDGGLLGRWASSDNAQIVRNNLVPAIDAAITLGTGAAYTEQQLAAKRAELMPMAGESDTVKMMKFDKFQKIYSRAVERARTAGKDLPPVSEFSFLFQEQPENPVAIGSRARFEGFSARPR